MTDATAGGLPPIIISLPRLGHSGEPLLCTSLKARLEENVLWAQRKQRCHGGAYRETQKLKKYSRLKIYMECSLGRAVLSALKNKNLRFLTPLTMALVKLVSECVSRKLTASRRLRFVLQFVELELLPNLNLPCVLLFKTAHQGGLVVLCYCCCPGKLVD